jgi:hypothetical protein
VAHDVGVLQAGLVLLPVFNFRFILKLFSLLLRPAFPTFPWSYSSSFFFFWLASLEAARDDEHASCDGFTLLICIHLTAVVI